MTTNTTNQTNTGRAARRPGSRGPVPAPGDRVTVRLELAHDVFSIIEMRAAALYIPPTAYLRLLIMQDIRNEQ